MKNTLAKSVDVTRVIALFENAGTKEKALIAMIMVAPFVPAAIESCKGLIESVMNHNYQVKVSMGNKSVSLMPGSIQSEM